MNDPRDEGMKKILMVAFHYPPFHGSSGVHRTLNFSRYLPEHGWQPIVLTVTPAAYPSVEPGPSRVPPGLQVERAFALDSGRHLSVKGIYPRLLALPDRWVGWWPGGVWKGLSVLRRHRPSLIWSTFPIATAHLVALALHRVSGVPWIADFRDPMTERDPATGEEFPTDPLVRKVNGWVERQAVMHCAKAVFTTTGTAQLYAARYPAVDRSRWEVIPNGYDEDSFKGLDIRVKPRSSREARRMVLLHSGTLYSELRNPRVFFEALAALRGCGDISPETLTIVLRGSGSERLYQSYLNDLRLEDMVRLESAIPYQDALAEMLVADGLLIFQASNCKWQIPAKIYEYFRARRPILAFTDPNGDTANLLRSEGIDSIAPIDSRDEIVRALRSFVQRIRNRTASLPNEASIERHSRRRRSRDLAALLDRLTPAAAVTRTHQAADAHRSFRTGGRQ